MKKFQKAQLTPSMLGTQRAIVIDASTCIACHACVDACRMSLILPQSEGDAPMVMYPDECWFCGVCVGVCPTGALTMYHPLNQCAAWKRKSTGEFFRIGMKNSLKPNTTPPTGA